MHLRQKCRESKEDVQLEFSYQQLVNEQGSKVVLSAHKVIEMNRSVGTGAPPKTLWEFL